MFWAEVVLFCDAELLECAHVLSCVYRASVHVLRSRGPAHSVGTPIGVHKVQKVPSQQQNVSKLLFLSSRTDFDTHFFFLFATLSSQDSSEVQF